MSLLNAVRKVADSKPLRGVLLRPRVRRAGAAVLGLRFTPAAWETRSPLRFLYLDVVGRGVEAYSLKGTGVRLVVRHDSGARELLYEVFRRGVYKPPPELLAQLPDDPLILDIGANVGAFAAFAITEWPTARVTCVEPDPDNVAALNSFVAANPRADIRVIAACAAPEAGTVAFASGLGSGSLIQEGGQPTPAIDIYPLMREADFVKCDIEGGEWPILHSDRLAGVGNTVLVMEYHRRFPGDQGAAQAASQLLRRSGFDVIKIDRNHWGHGVVWARKV